MYYPQGGGHVLCSLPILRRDSYAWEWGLVAWRIDSKTNGGGSRIAPQYVH